MELALPAYQGRQSPAEPVPTDSLRKKALVAGIALASASVLTITPTTSAVPALVSARTAEIQLAAATNPLELWQSTLTTAAGHLQYGLNYMVQEYPEWFGYVLGSTETNFTQLVTGLTNLEGWQQVFSDFQGENGYLARIQAAIEASQEGGDSVPDDIPDFNGMVENVMAYLSASEFGNAYAEFNQWFLWSLGGSAWPLLKETKIGSEILETLGLYRMANVWDALLVGKDGQGGAITDLTMFLFGPIVTANFAFADGLDDVVAAANGGNMQDALTEVLNLPAKYVDALLNGYNPRVASEAGYDWDWSGLLTKDGTLEHLLFTLPSDIMWALTQPREGEPTTSSGFSDLLSSFTGSTSSSGLTELVSSLQDSLSGLTGSSSAKTTSVSTVFAALDAEEDVDGATDPEEPSASDNDQLATVTTLPDSTTSTVTIPDAAVVKSIARSSTATVTDTAAADTTTVSESNSEATSEVKSAGAESAYTKTDAKTSKVGSVKEKLAKRFGKNKSSPSATAEGTTASTGTTDNKQSDSKKSDSSEANSSSESSSSLRKRGGSNSRGVSSGSGDSDSSGSSGGSSTGGSTGGE